MGNKNIAIGTVLVLVSIVTIALVAETFLTLQGINPIAALAAVTVAVIGIAWFKKTVKP
jgi:hypothetical protein